MNRGDFLRAAPLAMAGAMLPARQRPRVGHMDTNTPGVGLVDYVTLDGVRVERVFELNDVEGWLRCYTTLDANGLHPAYRTGEVEVFWREG